MGYRITFGIAITFLFIIIAGSPLYAQGGPAGAIGSQSKLKSYELHIPVGQLTNISAQDFASGKAVPTYIVNVYRWFVGFTLFLGVIALMFGGAIWILSGGSKGKVDQAKGIIKNSLVGIFLALGSYLLLWTISPNLVQFRPIQVTQVQDYGLKIKEVPPEEKKVDACKDCREETGSKFQTHYCFQDKECKERIKKDQGPCTNTIECVLGLSCNLTTKKCEDNPTNPLGLCCNVVKEEVFNKDGSAVSGSASYIVSGAIGGGKKRLDDCVNTNTLSDIGMKEEEKGVFPLGPDQSIKRNLIAGQKRFCILACPTLQSNSGTWVQPIDASRGCSVPPTPQIK